MLLQRTIEYLLYLVFFILLIKIADAATVSNVENASSESSINPPPASHATPTVTSSASSSKRDAMKRAIAECRTQLSWMCLKMEFVKIIERLAEKEELLLAPGVSVVRSQNASEVSSTGLMAEVARSFPSDPNTRLSGYIVNKLSSFLQTHSLRFKLIDTKTIAEARSAVETGRKDKSGKNGGNQHLVVIGVMMKGMLMTIGLGAISLLAGKALITALLALTLSLALGLKGHHGGGSKSTTYEIVGKPSYSSSHMHSHDEGHGHMGGVHSASGGDYAGYAGYARNLNLAIPNTLH